MAELVLEPEQARRRQRRWQKALGLLVTPIVVIAGYFMFRLIGGATAEVSEMGPWPAPEVEPAALLPPDLSALGLGPPRIIKARGSDTLWAEGTYDAGAVVEYRVSGEAALWIATLSYTGSSAAGNEFAGYIAWAEENCGRSSYLTLGEWGRIECEAWGGYNKTYRNEGWIIDIVATGTASVPPRQLVDDARDAMAQHWKTPD